MAKVAMYNPLDETTLPEDRLFERLDLNRDGVLDRQELRRAYRLGLVSPEDQTAFSAPPREVTRRYEAPDCPRKEDGTVDKVALWRQRRREEVRAHTQRPDRSTSPARRGDGSDSGTPARSHSPSPLVSAKVKAKATAKGKPVAKGVRSVKEQRIQSATKIQAQFRGNQGRQVAEEKAVKAGRKRPQAKAGRFGKAKTPEAARGEMRTRRDGCDAAITTPLLPASQSLLLLRFPDAQWPPPPRFEMELRKGLKAMGATLLANLDIKLVEGSVIAELRGPASLLADLCRLPLYNLKVLDFRVGEVRASETGPPNPGAAATKIQANFRGNLGRKEAKAKKRQVERETRPAWRSSFSGGTAPAAAAASSGARSQDAQRGGKLAAKRGSKQQLFSAKEEKAAEEELAATKIQASFRGKKARQDLAVRTGKPRPSPKELNEKRRAKTNSSTRRGKENEPLSKKQLPKENERLSTKQLPKRKSKIAPISRQKEEDNAASKIQCRFRGNKARKEVANLRETKGKVGKSVKPTSTAPQKTETVEDRRNKRVGSQAGTKLQPRGKVTRKEKDVAAAKIQARYRGNKARRKGAARKNDPNEAPARGTDAKVQSFAGPKAASARVATGAHPWQQQEENPSRATPRAVSPSPSRGTPRAASPLPENCWGAIFFNTEDEDVPEEDAADTVIHAKWQGSLARRMLDDELDCEQSGQSFGARGGRMQGVGWQQSPVRSPSLGRSSPGRSQSPDKGKNKMMQTLADEDSWMERVEHTSRYINVIRRQQQPPGALHRPAEHSRPRSRTESTVQPPLHGRANLHATPPRSRAGYPVAHGTLSGRRHSHEHTDGDFQHPHRTDSHPSSTPARSKANTPKSALPPPNSSPPPDPAHADLWLLSPTAHKPPSSKDKQEALWRFHELLLAQHGTLDAAVNVIDSVGKGGVVSMREMEEYFFKCLGLPEPQRQAMNMYSFLDKDANGRLTYKEIIHVLSDMTVPLQHDSDSDSTTRESKTAKTPKTPRTPKRGAAPHASPSASTIRPRHHSKRPSVESSEASETPKVAAKTPTPKRSTRTAKKIEESTPKEKAGAKAHHAHAASPIRSHAGHDPKLEKQLNELNNHYLGFRNPAGSREGFGVLRGRDGTTYSGQWNGGKRDGHGALFFDGGVFEGEWKDGNAQGFGNVYFKNGDHFGGPYDQNKKQGRGKYRWSDGAVEEGGYSRGVKSGWHVWKRGAEYWDLHYENGDVTAATRGTEPPIGKGETRRDADDIPGHAPKYPAKRLSKSSSVPVAGPRVGGSRRPSQTQALESALTSALAPAPRAAGSRRPSQTQAAEAFESTLATTPVPSAVPSTPQQFLQGTAPQGSESASPIQGTQVLESSFSSALVPSAVPGTLQRTAPKGSTPRASVSKAADLQGTAPKGSTPRNSVSKAAEKRPSGTRTPPKRPSVKPEEPVVTKASSDLKFDGVWKKEGTDTQFQIEGDEIIFLSNGEEPDKQYRFEVKSDNSCTVHTKSSKLQGTFVDSDGDGRPDLLKWTSGSVWVRVEMEEVEGGAW